MPYARHLPPHYALSLLLICSLSGVATHGAPLFTNIHHSTAKLSQSLKRNQADNTRQLAARGGSHQPVEPRPLSDADLLFVTGTDGQRLPLAQASRIWRRGGEYAGLTNSDGHKPSANSSSPGYRDQHAAFESEGAELPITVRAFIAYDNATAIQQLNTAHAHWQEVYEYFPSEGSPELGGVWHGSKDGDTRMALAPWLAHRAYKGQYKWILYGDDDTVFFLPGVHALLPYLDHNLPLALTDNLWGPPGFPGRHPSRAARRCLPCGYSVDYLPSLREVHELNAARDARLARLHGSTSKQHTSGHDSVSSAASDSPSDSDPALLYKAAPACPYCNSQQVCAGVGSHASDRQAKQLTPNPWLQDTFNGSDAGSPCTASGAHGGAGIIFSVGLMRHISLESMRRCALSYQDLPGGDSLITQCLFYNFTLGYTDPGTFHAGLGASSHLLFHGTSGGGVSLKKAKWLVTSQKCDERCVWLLRYAVSTHLGARRFGSFDKAVQALEGVVRGHLQALHALRKKAVDGG